MLKYCTTKIGINKLEVYMWYLLKTDFENLYLLQSENALNQFLLVNVVPIVTSSPVMTVVTNFKEICENLLIYIQEEGEG